MKHLKIFTFLFAACSSLSFLFSNNIFLSFVGKPNFFVKATSKYITYTYAQVKEDNIYLYKTNLSTFPQNAYFEIPKTYFVTLLNNMDDVSYKVEYNGLVGFVLKSGVTPVLERPQNIVPQNITFRVYSSDGLNMMSSPFSSLNPEVVTTLPFLPTLNYLGKIEADELVEGRGSTWYYCTYQNFSGYVYAGFCDSLTLIPPNTETVTPISNPFYNEDNEYLYNLINLSPFLKVLIITLVCLPCVVLIFLLFKPFKIRKLQNKNLTKLKTNNNNKLRAINKIQKVIEEDDTI